MAFETSIEVDGQLQLTEFQDGDVDQLVEYLDDPQIYATTLRIPSPYTTVDAANWIGIANQIHSTKEEITNWAIRDQAETLMGGIGFLYDEGATHRVEIGYWIARKFWGRDIASRCVKRVCELAFSRFNYLKVTAIVFDGNRASERVLEKNGFDLEGRHPAQLQKNGLLIDTKAFGLLRHSTPMSN